MSEPKPLTPRQQAWLDAFPELKELWDKRGHLAFLVTTKGGSTEAYYEANEAFLNAFEQAMAKAIAASPRQLELTAACDYSI